MPRLILASTSIYRRQLLERLSLSFDTARPEVDESPLPGESPTALAERLAIAKASVIAEREPMAFVIGSDQVAELEGRPLGKPGTRDGALAQLGAMSGRAVHFRTAVCVRHAKQAPRLATDTTTVRFRTLSFAEIERYVDMEQPLDCAGSFKSEGLGITLFDAIETTDPTALIGLPLIATARLLREAGFVLP